MAQGNNSSTTIVAIVSVLFVGVAGYFVYKGIKDSQDAKNGLKDKDKDKEPTDSTKPTTTTTTPTPTSGVDNSKFFSGFTFPIRRTQKSENVKKLQELLLLIDSKSIPDGATGYFGSQTESALEKYLGKKKVENQADIDVLRKLGLGKIGGSIATNVALAQFGIVKK
jgi:flagellar basal body-associated protein FliL